MTRSTSRDTADVGGSGPLPAQKAMKQFSKTGAEREEPVGPNDGPKLPERGDDAAVRPGDAGVGQSDNEGSSPYGDRSRKERPQRQS